MPFIPHTENEIADMLKAIGVSSIEDLFEEIPSHLRAKEMIGIPEGKTEMEVTRLLHSRAARNPQATCFIGAGAYEHHIPAAVWQITTRGEFYSAYTPYQAEASQGTLQLTYEFQSMMTALTAMDVSNASMYDGASALAESVLMAVRGNKKSKSRTILIPKTVHPHYRKTTRAIVGGQNIELIEVDYDRASGTTALDEFKKQASGQATGQGGQDITAIVIQQPNFFGSLEQVDEITDWAHQNDILVIAVVNPLTLTLLKPPGEWGADNSGADIVCGDGQPLGAPLASGGPYYGLLCCTQALVRQMPGRIVGRTVDQDGKDGYVLTLQAREQHIRRSKATSNICTNQGLVVTASTIHMAIVGPEGLENAAAACHANTISLVSQLTAIDAVNKAFDATYFHESVITLDRPVAAVLDELADKNILGGYDLSNDYPELGNALLVCATEMRSEEDIQRYAENLSEILSQAPNTELKGAELKGTELEGVA